MRRLALVGLATLACWGHPRANAATAIGDMRALTSSLTRYARACGGFPADLHALRDGKSAGDCEAFGGLPKDLLSGTHLGYRWAYAASEPLATSPGYFGQYELRATWVGDEEQDEPERRSFWTNREGQIRMAWGREAGPNDEVLK